MKRLLVLSKVMTMILVFLAVMTSKGFTDSYITYDLDKTNIHIESTTETYTFIAGNSINSANSNIDIKVIYKAHSQSITNFAQNGVRIKIFKSQELLAEGVDQYNSESSLGTPIPGYNHEQQFSSLNISPSDELKLEITVWSGDWKNYVSSIKIDTNWDVNLLTINKIGNGSGTVTCDGIECKVSYANGTIVTLSALSNSNSKFIGWSGDCVGNNTTCQLTIDKSKTVSAEFSLKTVYPWPYVEGKYIKDYEGKILQLKGVSVIDPEIMNTKRGDKNAASIITDAVNNYHANVIRIPVLPNPDSGEGTSGFFANPDSYFNNHLNPVITVCKELGVYVIIDLHYLSDYNADFRDNYIIPFWDYIAPKYKDSPNVIFEIFNEPINPDNWNTWLEVVAQPVVDKIRNHAPNNLIIVGGPRWSQNMSGAADNPVKGENIIYTAHVYPEHPSASWETNYGAIASKYPVFVTEWGYEKGAVSPTSGTTSEFGVPFSNWMREKELHWTAFSFDNHWFPRMFNNDWSLKTGEDGMGVFIQKLLYPFQWTQPKGTVSGTINVNQDINNIYDNKLDTWCQMDEVENYLSFPYAYFGVKFDSATEVAGVRFFNACKAPNHNPIEKFKVEALKTEGNENNETDWEEVVSERSATNDCTEEDTGIWVEAEFNTNSKVTKEVRIIYTKTYNDFAPSVGEIEFLALNSNTLPIADFDATPRNGKSPLSVQFNDKSIGNITSWRWDFGDGNTSNEQNPLHTYVASGKYTVSLAVTATEGTDTKVKEDYIVSTFWSKPRGTPFGTVNWVNGKKDIVKKIYDGDEKTWCEFDEMFDEIENKSKGYFGIKFKTPLRLKGVRFFNPCQKIDFNRIEQFDVIADNVNPVVSNQSTVNTCLESDSGTWEEVFFNSIDVKKEIRVIYTKVYGNNAPKVGEIDFHVQPQIQNKSVIVDKTTSNSDSFNIILRDCHELVNSLQGLDNVEFKLSLLVPGENTFFEMSDNFKKNKANNFVFISGDKKHKYTLFSKDQKVTLTSKQINISDINVNDKINIKTKLESVGNKCEVTAEWNKTTITGGIKYIKK